jgi:hypothetical protein
MNNAYCVGTMAETYGPHLDIWLNEEIKDGDKFIIVDVTNNPDFEKGSFKFTENNLREKFDFKHEVSKINFWNCQGNKTLAWFYAHLRMLNFYIKYSKYDYYWFFDDDIKMDDWNLFFDSFSNNDSDFLSYFCFKNIGINSQPNVPEMNMKSFSNFEWFRRFPGNGAVMPADTTELFGSFFPTTRFSNKALKTILDANFDGYHAYHEGFVPTILNKKGMKLSSIITPENTSNYFDVDKVNITHKTIRVTWEWI